MYHQKESAYSKYNLVSEDILLYSWDIFTRKGCAGFGEKICVFFLYGDGKSEIFKRECIELDKDKGGLGLYNLDTFCEAIFVQENVCIPSHKDFDHQRKDLFQYFFFFLATKLLL